MRFDELDFQPALLDAIDSMNFEECTPIQEKAIPILLEGHDLIGIAQTGTGKTAAYLLPVLDKLSEGGYPENAVNCLIMVPTRELAQQIDQQIEGFSYFTNISGTAVYGGNDGIRFEQEKRGFAMGTDIVVATPGRLISHISLGNIDLSKVSFFILDEADRMLDMGFYDDIMRMARTILHDPKEVKLAVSKPADKILQAAYVCYEAQKLPIIQSLFENNQPKRVIAFASSKLKVKEITKSLRRLGLNVGEMHSDLAQSERDDIMHKFRNGHINVLVATDIVSRGIDIDDIDLVINFDVPHDPEDYVHRIGRTARAGAEGCAITFVSLDDQPKFRQIERFLGKDVYKVPIPAELGESPEYAAERKKPHRKGHRPFHRRKN